MVWVHLSTLRTSGTVVARAMVPPSDPAAKVGSNTTMGGFARGRLSSEEAERLAATFKPCWASLEEAGHGAVRAPRAGTQIGLAPPPPSDYATNGSHAPPPPTPSHEPENSIIIDRGAGTGETRSPGQSAAPPGRQGPNGTLILRPSNAPGLRPPPARDAWRQGGAGQQQFGPSVRPRAASLDFEEGYPRPSKKGLWIGMSAVAIVLVGIGIWAAANVGGSDTQPAPIPVKPVQDKTAATVLPPLPEMTAKPQPLPAAPPPPPTAAAPPPVPPPVVTPAAVPPPVAPTPLPATPPVAAAPPALPPAAPTPTPTPAPVRVTAAPPPRQYYAPPARTPPPQRPKTSNQTIVRDVPF
jgi:hypothetical protein